MDKYRIKYHLIGIQTVHTTCEEADLLKHGEKVFEPAAEAVKLAKDVPIAI